MEIPVCFSIYRYNGNVNTYFRYFIHKIVFCGFRNICFNRYKQLTLKEKYDIKKRVIILNSFQNAFDALDYTGGCDKFSEGLHVCCGGIDVMHSLKSDILRNRPHGRNDYQIIYIRQGICSYIDTDGSLKSAGANSVLLFEPDVPQIYRYKSDNKTTAYWVHFSGEYAEQLLRSLGLTRRHFVLKSAPENYTSALTNIIYALRHKHSGYRSICTAELYRLLAYLSSQIISESGGRDNRYSSEIDMIVDEMSKNYSRPYPVSYYSGLCNLEENYFIKLFKLQVGTTPRTYIIRLRMEAASALLRETTLKLEDVAAAVGYENVYYFMEIFKKHTGITAGEFRKGAVKNLSGIKT